MPKGSSSSSSTNTTSTTTQDNKVSATDSAIALGNSSSFVYTDEFNDNVAKAVDSLIGLARDAGLVASSFATKAIQSNEKALEAVAQNGQRSQEISTLKDGVVFKDAIPYIAVTFIVLGLFSGFGRKSK